jgi:hypothetical protein
MRFILKGKNLNDHQMRQSLSYENGRFSNFQKLRF